LELHFICHRAYFLFDSHLRILLSHSPTVSFCITASLCSFIHPSQRMTTMLVFEMPKCHNNWLYHYYAERWDYTKRIIQWTTSTEATSVLSIRVRSMWRMRRMVFLSYQCQNRYHRHRRNHFKNVPKVYLFQYKNLSINIRPKAQCHSALEKNHDHSPPQNRTWMGSQKLLRKVWTEKWLPTPTLFFLIAGR